jgi:hypothetical protein
MAHAEPSLLLVEYLEMLWGARYLKPLRILVAAPAGIPELILHHFNLVKGIRGYSSGFNDESMAL